MIKDLIKRLILPRGSHVRRIRGGELKGLNFYFDLRASTQLWRGVYEVSLQHWISKYTKTGDVFLDVGAGCGYLTLLAAVKAGPTGMVHAFEPSDEADWIDRNTAVNPATQLAPIQIHKEFAASSSDPAAKRLSIDDVLARSASPRVDVVKIDVEGFEIDVLNGMERSLKQFRPHLFIEVHSRELLEAARKLCSGYGYDMVFEKCASHEQRPIEFNAFLYSNGRPTA